ncbi:hypothetical protein C9374_012932 [Naegleria lovaniensis]|uniref:Uncharacterized protein n=1 Tax=Naegleria lovaniensis TaxID=51637 RepID=A0AA88GE86_NAELO|nr:uncharacterized protein C9374_012932 [Naegleria lovaniensis]KAG2372989.1 hypothetical protein C9374_012932 [Naegleria lovaniensis]
MYVGPTDNKANRNNPNNRLFYPNEPTYQYHVIDIRAMTNMMNPNHALFYHSVSHATILYEQAKQQAREHANRNNPNNRAYKNDQQQQPDNQPSIEMNRRK